MYSPELHPNHGKPWTTKEVKYLVDYYGKISPEEISLSLGRTLHTIYQKATVLRKQGRLGKSHQPFRRLLRSEAVQV
ncbi:hypothetical protein NHG32_06980 [Aerococcaceae bacterium NML191219]|nr:hypothetical protein [Aerococcaceae bacterium NML191219]